MKRIALVAICLLHSALVAGASENVAEPRPFVPFLAGEKFRFKPAEPELANAVRQADVILTGNTDTLDVNAYDTSKGTGAYSGRIHLIQVFKGDIAAWPQFTWKPSATNLEVGSHHIFFVHNAAEKWETIKEIYVYEPWWPYCRTYGAYTGGREATIEAIKVLLAPDQPVLERFKWLLMAELDTDNEQRRSTAALLASEVNRPECLEPLLHAITKTSPEYRAQATYAACRLDGARGAVAGLMTVRIDDVSHRQIFDAIALAKDPKAAPVLERFGDEHPEHRVSCVFALRLLDVERLPGVIARWRADGKHAGIEHRLDDSRWRTETLPADELLGRALDGKSVSDE